MDRFYCLRIWGPYHPQNRNAFITRTRVRSCVNHQDRESTSKYTDVACGLLESYTNVACELLENYI